MIATMSADSRSLEEWSKTFPFFLNMKFLFRNILVLLESSFDEVRRYLQERIAKKMTPIRIHAIALSFGVWARSNIFRRTISGNAFCFFVAPSWFWYPLYCSWSKKHVLPSLSNLGSFRLFDRKACATYETVVLTVPSARC